MAGDRRRIQGPEVTVAPIIIKSSDKGKIQLTDANGQRRDGRNLEDIRPICMCSETFYCYRAQIKGIVL